METDMQETYLGSLGNYRKGSIEIIKGKPGHYAMSNVFEVASHAAPYEKVVVGKNLKYVIETVRSSTPIQKAACVSKANLQASRWGMCVCAAVIRRCCRQVLLIDSKPARQASCSSRPFLVRVRSRS